MPEVATHAGGLIFRSAIMWFLKWGPKKILEKYFPLKMEEDFQLEIRDGIQVRFDWIDRDFRIYFDLDMTNRTDYDLFLTAMECTIHIGVDRIVKDKTKLIFENLPRRGKMRFQIDHSLTAFEMQRAKKAQDPSPIASTVNFKFFCKTMLGDTIYETQKVNLQTKKYESLNPNIQAANQYL